MTEQEATAIDYTIRARAGDQNAMGMLAAVGENARKGNKRAIETFRIVAKYISEHPVDDSPTPAIGAELEGVKGCCFGKDPLPDLLNTKREQNLAAAVILSHGPALTNATIKGIGERFKGEQQRLFFLGVIHCLTAIPSLPSEGLGIYLAGHAIGLAQKLQSVRHPRSPIARLSQAAARELE